jgi:hypothetical protein
VKITVSMSVEEVEWLKALDAAGVIESVSGYVAEVVHDWLVRQAWLVRWWAGVGGPDREASVWVDEMIDRHVGIRARRVS